MKGMLTVVILFLALAGRPVEAAEPPADAPLAVTVQTVTDLEAILPRLAARRVVYLGEQHDRDDHHRNQLAILRGIHARHADVAIGMEMFTRPDQAALDAYIARAIDETEMRRRTDFDRRWRHGWRQYGAILEFARAQGLSIVALNAADELVAAVKAHGLAGLSEAQRMQLPKIDTGDAAYRHRLAEAYAEHRAGHGELERFIEVQLLWDESMAERLAEYLQAHPARRVVVLAGNGHVAHGSGIPQRVQRRLAVDAAIVVQDDEPECEPGVADYVLRRASADAEP
jgi:uncharacterized iron-regulated protein